MLVLAALFVVSLAGEFWSSSPSRLQREADSRAALYRLARMGLLEKDAAGAPAKLEPLSPVQETQLSHVQTDFYQISKLYGNLAPLLTRTDPGPYVTPEGLLYEQLTEGSSVIEMLARTYYPDIVARMKAMDNPGNHISAGVEAAMSMLLKVETAVAEAEKSFTPNTGADGEQYICFPTNEACSKAFGTFAGSFDTISKELQSALDQSDSGKGKYAIVDAMQVFADLYKAVGQAMTKWSYGFSDSGSLGTLAEGAKIASDAYKTAENALTEIMYKDRPTNAKGPDAAKGLGAAKAPGQRLIPDEYFGAVHVPDRAARGYGPGGFARGARDFVGRRME